MVGCEANQTMAASSPNSSPCFIPKPKSMPVLNKHLKNLPRDHLYHLGYSTSDDLQAMFGMVKLVICGGSTSRMSTLAAKLAQVLGHGGAETSPPANLCKSDRYVMFKVQNVLLVNHGMGQPSMLIMLHEVTKLLHYANATGVSYVRVGTCGGLGLEPGTLVVTKRPVDPRLKSSWASWVCGELVEREAATDNCLSESIVQCLADQSLPVVRGDTMATDDFYEGQGRLDGAVCSYDEAKKTAFLKRAYDNGVRNIEMECVVFAAFCHELGIPCAVACVTLLNRLEGNDQVSDDVAVHEVCNKRLQLLVEGMAKALAGL